MGEEERGDHVVGRYAVLRRHWIRRAGRLPAVHVCCGRLPAPQLYCLGSLTSFLCRAPSYNKTFCGDHSDLFCDHKRDGMARTTTYYKSLTVNGNDRRQYAPTLGRIGRRLRWLTGTWLKTMKTRSARLSSSSVLSRLL